MTNEERQAELRRLKNRLCEAFLDNDAPAHRQAVDALHTLLSDK